MMRSTNCHHTTPSEIGDIPVIPSPEPSLSEISNQFDKPDFFSITVDKYTNAIRNGYKTNRLFSKALIISGSNSIYHLDPTSDLLYQNSPSGGIRRCVPDVTVPVHDKQERLWNVLIDHIHEILGHFGYKILSSVYRHFYWKTLVSDVIYRTRQCHDCQVNNKSTPTSHQGLYQETEFVVGTTRELLVTVVGAMDGVLTRTRPTIFISKDLTEKLGMVLL